MSEIIDTIHNARRMGFTFSHIRDILAAHHGYKSSTRYICDKYNRWCQANGITPEKGNRRPPKTLKIANKEKDDWQSYAKKASMLHLLDLVRAHGEVVFNRLTGEVVSGGYINLDIPEVGTPKIITPNYHGSLVGSHALSCAENGK